MIGRGVAYRKTKETDLCSSVYGQSEVLLLGRGVAYRKTEETDLCWSAYGRNGVLFIVRGVAYRKMRLHGLLFIHCRLPPASTCYCSCTVHLLHPPLATVHPASTSYCSSMRSCSSSLPGYCSPSPPRGPVHPASTGYCSTSPPRMGSLHWLLYIHPHASSIGTLFMQRQRPLLPRDPVHPTPTRNCSSNPHIHCSSRGSFFDWLQLAAVAKESLDRVQLTAMDQSGFSNIASAIARV